MFLELQKLIQQELEKVRFPTELTDSIGELLGTRGKEFGTVTSRKRRCGWFDGVLVRQTIKVSGINSIALTKLDVLDELDEIKMCVAYELDGKKLDYLPAAVEDQIKIKPIYKTFQGWKVSTSGVKNMTHYPKMQKNISLQWRILLVQKFLVFQLVQKEMIQF